MTKTRLSNIIDDLEFKTTDLYNYHVFWSDDDEEYVALCAEFPSLSFLAPKRDDAVKGITDLVAEVIADMKTNGETVSGILTS